MKAKRIAVLLFTVFFVLSAVMAGNRADNRQEIITVDSEIWTLMKSLYIAEGRALPSTTGPWSASEMDLMLSRIDRGSLSSASAAIYDHIASELGKDARYNPAYDIAVDFSGDFSLGLWYHTNPGDFTHFDDFAGNGDFSVPTPMIGLPLSTWIGKNVYGYTSFNLGPARTLQADLSDVNLYTNILFLAPNTIGDLCLSFPTRGLGSIGGDNWNFTLGREKLSWGPGESGNLVIGDQVKYHDNARFTAFSDSYKYTFSISSFAHPMNYITTDSTGRDYLDLDYSQRDDRDGLKMFIAHRFEWTMLGKVGMAVTEAIMYQSATNKLDLMELSPTVLFHNYYIRSNANSILSIDIDYSPVKNLNLYASAVVDEFKLPGEFADDSKGPPSAFGFILGAKTAVPMEKGVFYASLEGVYTDPYLYLRDNGDEYGPEKYGINFVVATPEFNVDQPRYKLSFLGYRYGNDCVTADVKAGFISYGKWYAEGGFTFIADGCFDENTRWIEVYKEGPEDYQSPTSVPNTAGDSFDASDNTALRNAVALWSVLTLKGGYNVTEKLALTGSVTYVNVLNWMNVKGQKSDDFRFSMGVSYSL